MFFEPLHGKRFVKVTDQRKHGSWLNMAEIELGVLIRQYLSRRISNKAALVKQARAWQNDRNTKVVKVD